MLRKLFFIHLFLCANTCFSSNPSTSIQEFLSTILIHLKEKETNALEKFFAPKVMVYVGMGGNEYEFLRSHGYKTQALNGKYYHISEILYNDEVLKDFGFRSRSIRTILKQSKEINTVWDEQRLSEYEGMASSPCMLWVRTGRGEIFTSNDVQIYFKPIRGKWYVTGIQIIENAFPKMEGGID